MTLDTTIVKDKILPGRGDHLFVGGPEHFGVVKWGN